MMDIIADILNDHQCDADTLRRDHDQHPKPRRGRCNICDNINTLTPLVAEAIRAGDHDVLAALISDPTMLQALRQVKP